MGLDLVELVPRTEEVFGVDLPDEECQLIRTVGDLYRLTLEKLALPYERSDEIESNYLGRTRPLGSGIPTSPWTAADTWLTLKALIREQLGTEPSAIKESAGFIDDLRCE